MWIHQKQKRKNVLVLRERRAKMSKYNSNAGFKNYDVPSEEENQETVSSPLSKLKTGLIFGGIAFGVVVILVVVMMLVSNGEEKSDDMVDNSSQVEVASYDYDELFGVTTAPEETTIKNPYDGINNNNPQSATKPAVAPAQSSNSSDSSNGSSGNSSANSNNGSNNSGGNNNNGNDGGNNSGDDETGGLPPFQLNPDDGSHPGQM